MGYGIRVEAWGPYALFSRPEMKAERVSYDVITPSAARGLIEAVYWKPAIRWKIDRIYVCNPIRFTNIRRNEVASKISASVVRSAMNGGDMPYLNTSAEIQQRASMALYDVRYIIDAHFELTDKAGPTDTEEKHYAIAAAACARVSATTSPAWGAGSSRRISACLKATMWQRIMRPCRNGISALCSTIWTIPTRKISIPPFSVP